MRTEDCACGGTITADPDNPAGAVLEHNRTERHALWRHPRNHRCEGYGSPCVVYVPMGRRLCNYCRRTAAMGMGVA